MTAFARAVPARTSHRHSDAKALLDTQPTLRFACLQDQMIEQLGGVPWILSPHLFPSQLSLRETLWRRVAPGPSEEEPHHSESVSGPERAAPRQPQSARVTCSRKYSGLRSPSRP